jgi:hypothetical protein
MLYAIPPIVRSLQTRWTRLLPMIAAIALACGAPAQAAAVHSQRPHLHGLFHGGKVYRALHTDVLAADIGADGRPGPFRAVANLPASDPQAIRTIYFDTAGLLNIETAGSGMYAWDPRTGDLWCRSARVVRRERDEVWTAREFSHAVLGVATRSGMTGDSSTDPR